MASSQSPTFSDLHDLIAKTVAKIGLSNTIVLLETISGGKNINTTTAENVRLVIQFLTSRCLRVFNLEEDQFKSNEARECRDARMAVYHLVKKYTDSSYAFVALQFGQKKRNVLYACQKCDEILSVGQFHKAFVDKYNTLEVQTLEFIAKLNSSPAYENSNA